MAEIIQKIKKYDSLLDDEYGENALEMRNKIDEIEDLVQKEENPSRIKALLNDIKNLSIDVTVSDVASGDYGDMTVEKVVIHINRLKKSDIDTLKEKISAKTGIDVGSIYIK